MASFPGSLETRPVFIHRIPGAGLEKERNGRRGEENNENGLSDQSPSTESVYYFLREIPLSSQVDVRVHLAQRKSFRRGLRRS